MVNISLILYTKGFFSSVLKSPTQMGSLSINISRLGTFKGLSQDRRADFSEDLRGSLFNADLSNKPILSARSISPDYLCAKEKMERIRPEEENEFVEKIKQN